jgi:predicted phosphodiesterase
MAGKPTIVGTVARQYCERHKTASTRALARMLVRDEPKLFANFNAACMAVRYIRGSIKPNGRGAPKPTKREPLTLPPSFAKSVTPITLQVRGKGLVISDVHLPYHDEAALQAAVDYAVAKGHTDFAILNGDILDCYQLSQWVRDPRKRRFEREIQAAVQFLRYMADKFGKVVYKFGNHETRYDRYMMQHAPELMGIKAVRLHRLLGLEKLGIEYVPANRVMHAGALTILHGHEYGQGISNPVNPARGMFLKANACTISGHLHQTSHHNNANIRGVLTSCWSTGCLADLHPEFAALNRWDHGFALMEFDGKNFTVQTKRIIEGQVF